MDSQEIINEDSQEVLTIRTGALAMFLLSLVMFFIAVNAVLVAHWGLSGWNIDLQPDSFNRWVFLGSLVTLVVVHEAVACSGSIVMGKGAIQFDSFRCQMEMDRPILSLCEPDEDGRLSQIHALTSRGYVDGYLCLASVRPVFVDTPALQLSLLRMRRRHFDLLQDPGFPRLPVGSGPPVGNRMLCLA